MTGNDEELNVDVNTASVDGGQDQAQTEPVDISQAFQMYREQNSGVAQDPVVEPEQPAVELPATEPERSVEPAPVETSGSDGFGGSSVVDTEIDYGSYTKNLTEQVQKTAIDTVAKKFKEHEIELFTIDRLYQKDERTGRVEFVNPDDPNVPFKTRTEAQAWIDSMNRNIKDSFNMAVRDEQKRLMEQYAPTFNYLKFGPTLAKMSEDEKMVLNQITQPYAIVNNGKIVGYKCDLNAAANQARSLVKSMRDRWGTQQQAPAPVSTPSVDAKSHGSSSNTVSDPEPTNISEAMLAYQKQMRDKKKGK